MRFERLKQRVRSLQEVAAWPQMLDVMERAIHQEGRSVWEYPVASCQAVGSTADAALPGAAAIFCSLTSIHLVDDMLDEDPHGDYRFLGAGYAANLALAFQAAAHRLIEEAAVDSGTRTALQASLARMALATSFGQALDARELRGEEDYWRAVEAKTPPLFASALAIGALLGGASPSIVHELERLGRVMGRFIQVSDDLADALKAPAGADWYSRTNNLPILYALTAEHREREEFLRLSARPGEPAALAAAQRILLRSGAVSYCALKLIELSRQARDLLAGIPLEDAEPVASLLDLQARPLTRLLGMAGMEALELVPS